MAHRSPTRPAGAWLVAVSSALLLGLTACGGGGGSDSSSTGDTGGGGGGDSSGPVLTVVSSAAGKVSSSPAGIADCSANCTASFSAGTRVTLSVSALNGYVFAGWSGGGCSGTEACTLSMDAATTVTARFTALPVTGTTYFVATTGNDSNDGLSLTTPWRTLNKAVQSAHAGDVIEVRAGTYDTGSRGLIIDTQGSEGGWITLRGYNGERPVLQGSGSGPTVYFYNDACDEEVIGSASGNTSCFNSFWTLQGLEIRGSAAGADDGNAVKIDTAHVRLIGNKLCCSVADVVKLVRTANDVAVLDNEIWQDSTKVTPSDNAQGVDIVGADRARVAGNFLHDIPDFGIYAKGNARAPVFENNRLVNIGRDDNGHALMLGQETDADRLADGTFETYDGIVRNNVVVGATWACLAVSSSSNARFYNNSCFDTASAGHASIFISNESEVGQVNVGLEFVNNIIYGSANRPVFKLSSGAMDDPSGLHVDSNLFFVSGGAPMFSLNDNTLSFARWPSAYQALTGHADTSVPVADPLYQSTSASDANPLTLSAQSPLRSKAGKDVSALVPTDRLGVARPQNGAMELGAYEY